jgi:hypothetical protein
MRPWLDVVVDGCANAGHKLVNEFDFLVLPRPGYPVPDLSAFGPRFSWLKFANNFSLVESNASSTEVRKRAKYSWKQKHAERGGSLSAMEGLVPPAVLAFALRYKLFKDLNSSSPLVRTSSTAVSFKPSRIATQRSS